MQERTYWSAWAQELQRRGLKESVATLLEAVGPVGIILAQAVYIGQPLLGGPGSAQQGQALAHLLEDRQEQRSFVAFLRNEGE